MEIEEIRKELNHLLNSVVEHSSRYSDERPIPSLEISFVLTKINKMQENLSVLKHLLKQKERASKKRGSSERISNVKEEAQEEKLEQTITQPETSEEVTPTLSDNLEQSPIPKLVDALTLNDRYLYANELFDKDMNVFNDLVKSIDSSPSLDKAKELFTSLNWDSENEHVLSFIALVERRFI